MRRVLLALLGLAACSAQPAPSSSTTALPGGNGSAGSNGSAVASAPPGKCDQLWTKLRPWMESRAKASGHTITDEDREELLASCRRNFEEGQASAADQKIYDCIMAASTDAAIAECMEGGRATKKSEAAIALNRIGKSARIVFYETAAFPKGNVPLTPSKSCCEGPSSRCPASDIWTQPTWVALDFDMIEAHQFQYSYDSDGTTFTAKAVGDLDCDGTTITYVLTGKIVDGTPQLTITEPTNPD